MPEMTTPLPPGLSSYISPEILITAPTLARRNRLVDNSPGG